MSRWRYIKNSDPPSDLVSESELVALIQAGALSANDAVRGEREDAWRPVSAVKHRLLSRASPGAPTGSAGAGSTAVGAGAAASAAGTGGGGWKYSRAGVLGGPVGEAEVAALIRAGRLGGDDAVWSRELGSWQPVGAVADLLLGRNPPPAQAPPAPAVPISAAPTPPAPPPPAPPPAAPTSGPQVPAALVSAAPAPTGPPMAPTPAAAPVAAGGNRQGGMPSPLPPRAVPPGAAGAGGAPPMVTLPAAAGGFGSGPPPARPAGALAAALPRLTSGPVIAVAVGVGAFLLVGSLGAVIVLKMRADERASVEVVGGGPRPPAADDATPRPVAPARLTTPPTRPAASAAVIAAQLAAARPRSVRANQELTLGRADLASAHPAAVVTWTQLAGDRVLPSLGTGGFAVRTGKVPPAAEGKALQFHVRVVLEGAVAVESFDVACVRDAAPSIDAARLVCSPAAGPVKVGQTLRFDAAAAIRDDDGPLSIVTWAVNGKPVGTGRAMQYVPPAGTSAVEVSLTVSDGAQADTKVVGQYRVDATTTTSTVAPAALSTTVTPKPAAAAADGFQPHPTLRAVPVAAKPSAATHPGLKRLWELGKGVGVFEPGAAFDPAAAAAGGALTARLTFDRPDRAPGGFDKRIRVRSAAGAVDLYHVDPDTMAQVLVARLRPDTLHGGGSGGAAEAVDVRAIDAHVAALLCAARVDVAVGDRPFGRFRFAALDAARAVVADADRAEAERQAAARGGVPRDVAIEREIQTAQYRLESAQRYYDRLCENARRETSAAERARRLAQAESSYGPTIQRYTQQLSDLRRSLAEARTAAAARRAAGPLAARDRTLIVELIDELKAATGPGQ